MISIAHLDIAALVGAYQYRQHGPVVVAEALVESRGPTAWGFGGCLRQRAREQAYNHQECAGNFSQRLISLMKSH
jgi:hypothetical protein